MYLTHLGQAKAALDRLAANSARLGNFHFHTDAAGRTPPAVHHYLQEVAMIPVPTPKGKAAGATAASGQLRSNCSLVTPFYHPIAETQLASLISAPKFLAQAPLAPENVH